MAKVLYCWRCRKDTAMLEEHEWEQVLSCLREGIVQIQHYRQTHDASLYEAKNHVYWQGALVRYNQITGSRETDPPGSLASQAQPIRSAMSRLRQATAHATGKAVCCVRSFTRLR